MTKAELIREIKRIQKEEQDYQALFKLILKKSGKDIRSMSDEEKKKFFSAVDKAYKAKTEGKLYINNKKNLNEGIIDIITNPMILAIAIHVVPFIISGAVVKLNRYLNKSEFEESVKIILNQLKDDEEFIQDLAKVIASVPKVNYGATKKISEITKIRKLAAIEEKKYDKKAETEKNKFKYYRTAGLAEESISNATAEVLIKAFNDSDIKNQAAKQIVNKLK